MKVRACDLGGLRLVHGGRDHGPGESRDKWLVIGQDFKYAHRAVLQVRALCKIFIYVSMSAALIQIKGLSSLDGDTLQRLLRGGPHRNAESKKLRSAHSVYVPPYHLTAPRFRERNTNQGELP